MSYQVEVVIVCDYPGCNEQLWWRQIDEGGLTKTRAGAYARHAYGWKVGGSIGSPDPKRAFCPAHKEVVK